MQALLEGRRSWRSARTNCCDLDREQFSAVARACRACLVAAIVATGGCGRIGFGGESLACPDGFIPAPSAPALGVTSPFCVAKYEMKLADGIAVSVPEGVPEHTTNLIMARARCAAMGSGYALSSNREAMSLARDIETVGANWSTGVARTGQLARGHCDWDPNAPQPASADDREACYLTNDSCSDTVWHIQRRTHVLSNGEVIWDFSGNTWEWLDWVVVTDKAGEARLQEVNAPAPTVAMPPESFKSSHEMLTSLNGIGWYYPGTNGTGGAAQRGGSYYESSNAGVFSLSLSAESAQDSSSSTDSGYRCVFRP